MKLEEIQEFNRKAIITACNPAAKNYDEALELEKLNMFCLAKISDQIVLYNCVKNIYKKEVLEVLGLPLTLDRVLISLSVKEIGYKDGSLFEVSYHREIFNHPVCDWDLTKPTLEEQDEETQQEVAKMLGWRCN